MVLRMRYCLKRRRTSLYYMEHQEIIEQETIILVTLQQNIETMKELRNILSLVNNITNDADAERIFGEIAHELMSNYQVRKNNKQYRFLEIEFYWHSLNHPDESVYPRQKSEGYWFLHPSGVDITLPSTTTDSYGGILIRAMQNVAHPEEVYSGPWNCSDALFDYLPMDGRGMT